MQVQRVARIAALREAVRRRGAGAVADAIIQERLRGDV